MLALAPVQKAWTQQKQFIADASHELNTPLTVILANQDILLSSPNQTIQEQRKWIESSAFEQGVELQTQINDSIFISGHSSQLIQLFSILLDNACKYSPANSVVSIQLFQDHKIHFIITNPGSPMEMVMVWAFLLQLVSLTFIMVG